MSDVPDSNNRKAVYTIVDGNGGGKARWTRIGIAFVNRDQSLNLVLDAVPVNGKIHIRDFPERGDDAQD
jgi:hypothetical protein